MGTTHYRQKAQGPLTPHTRQHTREAGEPQEATPEDEAVLDQDDDEATGAIAYSQLLEFLEAGVLRRVDLYGVAKIAVAIFQTGEKEEHFICDFPGAAQGFLQRLMSTMGPAAMAAAIAKLRPHIEAKVNAHGLTWDDVLPAIELIDSVDEILAAIDDAEAFLSRLLANHECLR